MRPLVVSLGLAACLAALIALGVPHADGALIAAPTSVAVGVVAAAALFGQLDWLTVCCGAVSPLAWTLLARYVRLDVGVAACLLLWAAPLWSRLAPGRWAIPVGVAAAAAGVGGVVIAAYVRSDVEHRLIACLFAGAALAMATSLAEALTAKPKEQEPSPDTARSGSDPAA